MKQQLLKFRLYLLAVLLVFSSSVLFAQTTPRWEKISSGNNFNVAISSDGKLWAWGQNDIGQLAQGDLQDEFNPQQIGTDSNWSMVACGLDHVVALKADNTLWTWGKNGKGQLGISSSGGYKNVPQQVPGTTWALVGAGWKSSFAIRNDGSLWAWGENNFGQLGLGNTADLNVPTLVGSKNWTSVDGGNSHTMAVDENNTLWAWGKNDKGQLGDNSTVDKTSPVQISTDYFYNASCGADQSYAVSGGFYYGCGDYRSQTDSALTIIKVNPLYEGGYVQAFNKTAIFIDENNGGVIYGIGDNSNGQFGNGTTISSDTFVTLNKVYSSQFGFSVGMTHSAIIEGSPNYLLCMAGQNGKGQLGSLIPSTLSRFNCLSYPVSELDFVVSKKESDSKVKITWDLPLKLNPTTGNPPAYIQVRNYTTGQEIYSEVIDSINNYTRIEGNTLAYLKPDEEYPFELRVIEYGPGTVLQDLTADLGSTLPFQKPTMAGTPISPWEVSLDIDNKSDYANKLYLYRDDSLISILDTSANNYQDICQPLVNGSIVNGETNTYRLLAINLSDEDSIYGDDIISQSTYLVDFKASDNTVGGEVDISWNNLNDYVSRIVLLRDGNVLQELMSDDIGYSDITAIPGFDHVYSLELYVEDELKITFSDLGSVQANGSIVGRVFNSDAESPYSVSNAKVVAKTLVAGKSYIQETTTDDNGEFSFSELEYYTASDFTITVTSLGVVDSALVSLTLEDFEKNIDVEIGAKGKEFETLNHSINSFVATADNTQGNVKLTWEITGTDTVHYLIYRDRDLIEVGNQINKTTNEYFDLSGTPWVNHDYSIVTYDRALVSGEFEYLFNTGSSDSARYPQPAPVTNFAATAIDLTATVDLSWNHPRGNIDGYRIFRNDSLIGTVPKAELSFTDFTGANGIPYTYSIHSFKYLDGTSYNSSKQFGSSLTYPILNKPTTVVATPDNFGSLKITWNYTNNIAYNFDGFYVTRSYNGDSKKIAYIRRDLPRDHLDYLGVPSRDYTYSITAAKRNLESESSPTSTGVTTYPKLPKVTVLQATSADGMIQLNTQLPNDGDYLDIVVQNESQTSTITQYRGNTSGTSIPWNNYTNETAVLTLTAVKTIDGVQYFGSDITKVNVAITESGPYDLPSVTSLVASTTYASHVKLNWDYPNYYIPAFYIYRDGTLIDSVVGVQKVYYDHDVNGNNNHLYQVEVRIDSRKSKRVGAIGRRQSRVKVYGTLYTESSKQGVENGLVYLYVNDGAGFSLLNQTTTNASGYYEFNEVPALGLIEGQDSLEVEVEHPNARFAERIKSKPFYDSLLSYTFNFADTLPSNNIPDDTITGVSNLIANANFQNQSVEIRWSANNGNYTSFEVYRGLVLVQTVQGSHTKIVIDDEGLPGYDYVYRVRPIWQKDRFTTEEGNYFSVIQTFPSILPVEELNASILQDEVRVNWSHSVDMNLNYEVRRNNLLMEIVRSGERLEYLDTTGTIGSIYKYTITPTLMSNALIQGPEESVTVVFPTVQRIKAIAATNVPNGIELTWKRPSPRATHYKVYCNNEVVDTLESAADIPSFTSYSGIPNSTNLFEIASGYEEGGLLYFGKRREVQFTQDKLTAPSLSVLSPIAGSDRLEVANSYIDNGISGLEVHRAGTAIGTVKYNPTGNYLYNDKTGIPENTYQYKVRAYSIRDGITYYSDLDAGVTATFPVLSAPTAVIATNVNDIYRTITWEHNREDVTFNITRTKECGSILSVATTIDGKLRKYNDDEVTYDSEVDYGVVASLIDNNTIYTSDTTYSNTLMRSSGYSLYSTGNNNRGQLGQGNTVRLSTLKLVGNSSDWVHVSSAQDFSFGIKSDGTLWGWGFNYSYSPTQIGTATDWAKIESRGTHSIALKQDGTLWSWGTNNVGQLGQGTYTNVSVPTQIGADTGWRTISAGSDVIYAIKKDGTLWGAGDNWFFQLADPGRGNFKSLVQIGSDNHWKSISAGTWFTLGLDNDGNIWSWGRNNLGQLGLGYASSSIVPNPTKITTTLKFKEVSAGSSHSLARSMNNDIYVWGNNKEGEHGLGTTGGFASSLQPTANGCAIEAGAIASFYSSTDFENTYAVGQNAFGNLGTGNISTNINQYAKISSVVRKVSNNSFHTLALGEAEAINNPNFTASNGSYGSKVYLSWNSQVSTPSGSGIIIYRDGELLSNEPIAATSYMDLTAIPGVKHVYSIKVEKSSGALSAPSNDIGWRTPNGVVRGNVITAVGSQPVPDVTLSLKSITAEGNFYYTTTSDSRGNFKFEDVYYGEDADVEVVASYPGHEFFQDTLFGVMDETLKDIGIGTFIDQTANLITGSITRRGLCPMDSIPVTLVRHYTSKADVEETRYSTADGNYAFSVNPFENDLSSFEIVLPDSVATSTTRWYEWNRNNIVVLPSAVNTNTPSQNFQDTLGVPYQFRIGNSCSTFPNTVFSIDINSTDGCFQKTLVSNDNGVFDFEDLPPLDYIVEVKSASPLTSSIIPILEYLSVRPIKLDLSEYGEGNKGDSSLNNLYNEKREFIYHNTPSFNLVRNSGIENVLCYPEVLRVKGTGSEGGAVDVNVSIEVQETHGVDVCHVNEGYLIIKNNGATEPSARLNYDSVLGKFPNYTFTPGLPATIAPYYKTVIVEYHTKQGFVAQTVYQLLIEGKASQPGSDVIVDKQEGKDFQIPLAVLRDPPGDGSYSYVEKGVETTNSYSVSSEVGGSFTLAAEGLFRLFGAGVEIKASAEIGGSRGTEESFSISHTTTQRFETSAESDVQTSDGTEYLVGDNADIIVGTGMALKYGIVESITYVEGKTADNSADSCFILKSSEIGLSPDKLKTTWVYTVSQIEDLIEEYEYSLELAKQGRLTLSDAESGKDTSYYRTLIANWQSVLDYHNKNTVPQYSICDPAAFDAMFPNVFPLNRVRPAALSVQRNCFCAAAGEYRGNTYVQNEDFEWNDELLDKYKYTRQRLEDLFGQRLALSANDQVRILLSESGGVFNEILDELFPLPDLYLEADFLSTRSVFSAETNAYAENITFSGNTSIEKSLSYSQSSSHSLSQSFFTNGSIYAGVLYGAKVEIGSFVGLGGGTTLKADDAVDAEQRLGGEIKVEFQKDWVSETSNTLEQTSGYVLSDDDAGDQFSVTVIKGLQNSHTPYFDLFAGRSSCPYEEGTLARDRPRLTLEYSDGTPFENNVQRDVDPDEPAYYALKLSNLASEIFDEPRYYNIVQAANSNQNGAQLTADGSGQYYPLVYSVPSGGATYTGFYANKAGISYDYPDLDLQMIPTCLDPYVDLVNGFDGAGLHMEAYFRRPCSGVSILDPIDNWRIIRTRDEFGNPAERLQVQLGDYDPENIYLENISMEYRRIGTNEWEKIRESEVSKDSLQTYYNLYKSTYKDPVYNFVWDVFGKDEIIDGEYEIRAVVECGLEGKVYSDVSTGVIDRSAIALYGVPRPTDGVLNIGESVEVLFNEPVECGYETKANSHYSFTRKEDGAPLEFTPVCSGNSIIYNFDGDLDTLDQKVIQMAVFGVQDLNGNALADTVHYEFIVSNTPVSWQPYSLQVDVYRGESKLVDVSLVNTGATKANVTLTKTGSPTDLLTLFSTTDSIFANSRISVPFRVNAQNSDIGVYNFELLADVSTFADDYGITRIPVTVNVVATPPEWIVPSGKSKSTVVICNLQMDSVLSTDTMDRIAITIDNEVRGFSNVYKSRAGNDLYYAVINVQGDAADNGKAFGYRVWNAKKGAEYDGNMIGSSVTFDGGVYGTTLNPRIIDVRTEWDSVRYIPLIKGWNWLAFNYEKESMSVSKMLNGLNVTGGEIIKTQTQEAYFDTTMGDWFNTGTGLSTVNTSNGYYLRLNDDDVLRVSGKPATSGGVSIVNGWSLIGNPNQENVSIDLAFAPNTDLKEGAILKAGGAINKAAVYEDGKWTGTITEYETNQAYMIQNSKASVLQFKTDEVVASNFEYNMTMLGGVIYNWNELREEGDYVVAYIDGVVRGKAELEEVNTPVNRFMLNLFIYGDADDIDKEIKFKLYKQDDDEYYDLFIRDSILFTPDDHYGAPNNPYWFSNDVNFVDIEELEVDDLQFNIYPNPFRSNVKVKLNSEGNSVAKIHIYNGQGQEVSSLDYKCTNGVNTIELDTKVLTSGLYFIRLEINNRVGTQKLIKY